VGVSSERRRGGRLRFTFDDGVIDQEAEAGGGWDVPSPAPELPQAAALQRKEVQGGQAGCRWRSAGHGVLMTQRHCS
jgi:hypothetical protein